MQPYMFISRVHTLDPCARQEQKSFWGKALYFSTPHYIALKSYGTIVCSYDTRSGTFHRHWSGYSRTTLRHVEAFLSLCCERERGVGKSEWENLPVESVPHEILDCFCY